ncbi:MAG TPA: hypothetical protein VFP72_00470 [Kineosporiaceae bacterium]|nr:hypothetical protein [Kineosporiaceae bacterium]
MIAVRLGVILQPGGHRQDRRAQGSFPQYLQDRGQPADAPVPVREGVKGLELVVGHRDPSDQPVIKIPSLRRETWNYAAGIQLSTLDRDAATSGPKGGTEVAGVPLARSPDGHRASAPTGRLRHLGNGIYQE